MWWKQFLRDSGGRPDYLARDIFFRGGIEAIYDDIPQPLGLSAFAPTREARGPMFGARQRLGIAGEAAVAPAVAESDLK